MAHHWSSPHCWWCLGDPKEDPECWGQQAALRRVWWKSRTGNGRIDVHYYIYRNPAMMARKVWEAYEEGAIIAGPSKIPWAFKVSSVFVFTLELHSEWILSFSDLFAWKHHCLVVQYLVYRCPRPKKKKYSWERIGKVHNFTLKTWGTVG